MVARWICPEVARIGRNLSVTDTSDFEGKVDISSQRATAKPSCICCTANLVAL